uniref:Uncharacterized protein n=1 Tax=Amphimedon queenslandica TaxID=400682 RepID=A0A1X7VE40_AMPQE
SLKSSCITLQEIMNDGTVHVHVCNQYVNINGYFVKTHNLSIDSPQLGNNELPLLVQQRQCWGMRNYRRDYGCTSRGNYRCNSKRDC